MPRNQSEKPDDTSEFPPGWRIHRWPGGRVQLQNARDTLRTHSDELVTALMISDAWRKWEDASGLNREEYQLIRFAKERIDELETALAQVRSFARQISGRTIRAPQLADPSE